MAIIVPNEGKLELIEKMIKDALSTDESFSLRLYKNDFTASESVTLSDFTEADFDDYERKTLSRSGWNSASLNLAYEAEIEYSAEQSWTCGTTGGSVYGYYVVGSTSGKVLWYQEFNTSVTLANGDILKLTPTFALRSRKDL